MSKATSVIGYLQFFLPYQTQSVRPSVSILNDHGAARTSLEVPSSITELMVPIHLILRLEAPGPALFARVRHLITRILNNENR